MTRSTPTPSLAARIAIGIVVAAILTLALLPGSARRPRPAAPQNLIVISIDTLRADHLGVYGHARGTSPNLDRFARRSTRFTQAIAHAPNTPPSQLSLLTSLYYSVHGFSGHHGRFAPEITTLPEMLRDEGFATAGFVDGGYLGRELGFADGFDRFTDDPVHVATILDRAERWLDGARRDPFFLFIHCYDVHSPYTPPAPYDRMFVDPAYAGGFVPTNDALADIVEGRRTITAADAAHAAALYDGAIRYVDNEIGRFLDGLRTRGYLRSTIVVITSDHGEEFLEHDSMLHWQAFFRPNLHVPLLVRVPGGRGVVVDGVVEQIDVMPTVLDLLSLPPASEAMGATRAAAIRGDGRVASGTAANGWIPQGPGAPGFGSSPAVASGARGRSDVGDDTVAFAEPWDLTVPWRTLVSERWQFRHNASTGAVQLHDLEQDPFGTVDVAVRHPEVVARFVELLDQRQARIAATRAYASVPFAEPPSDDLRARLVALGYVLREVAGP